MSLEFDILILRLREQEEKETDSWLGLF